MRALTRSARRLTHCLAVLALFAGVGACRSAPEQPTPGPEWIRVLLDTDANNELDDQHAIAYLLFNGGVFDVEGITVNRTRAGGDVRQHYAEAERVVRLASLQGEVPLLLGADGSFTEIEGQLDRPDYDGAPAVRFIIERAHAADPRPLVLLPVGKLTNIALALKKDPANTRSAGNTTRRTIPSRSPTSSIRPTCPSRSSRCATGSLQGPTP